MTNAVISVVGVHPIQAGEPVWLVEAEIFEPFDEIDWGSISQPDAEKDQSYWQVPYDERELVTSSEGKKLAVFFFHYLQLDRHFESAYGPLMLPPPSPLPERLRFVEYESP